MKPIMIIYDRTRVDFNTALRLADSFGLPRERVVASGHLHNDPVSVIFEPPPKRSWIQKIFGGGK